MRNLDRIAAFSLLLILSLWSAISPSPVHAADTSRRIAVAPFAVNGQDDVRPVAALLPRLLASRLMALAGVDAPVLAASDKSPADAAKEADAAFLLQGSVARLGKGYSIDVTVLDAISGKSAGAFFASPANEDEIIPAVGRLAEEISEKLFAVKPAARPLPAAASPASAPPSPAVPSMAPAAATRVPVQPAAADAPAGDWAPSAIKKLGQSDKIADELFGVVALTDDPEGGEVIAWGKNTLYFYRVRGGALQPWTRLTRELNHHFLNVDVNDLDGDGANEILVTDRVNERIESFILKRKGDVYEEIAEKIPYYLAVLADRKGRRVVAGQRSGVDAPFQGKFLAMEWSGSKLAEGEPLPVSADKAPMSAGGILGLSAARLGDADRFLYSDESGLIRVLDESGKTVYKGKSKFGYPGHPFEWGPYNQLEGKREQVVVRESPRIVPFKAGMPMLLAIQMKNPGILSRISGSEIEGSRVVLLQWEDSEFVERAASKYTDFQFTGADLLARSALRPGAGVVVSVIEQPAGLFKDRVSRLVLLSLE
ncbi:MAG TPA: VCBS repeat-containing protein [Candidatus Deferrimicrobiaceae bacterium]